MGMENKVHTFLKYSYFSHNLKNNSWLWVCCCCCCFPSPILFLFEFKELLPESSKSHMAETVRFSFCILKHILNIIFSLFGWLHPLVVNNGIKNNIFSEKIFQTQVLNANRVHFVEGINKFTHYKVLNGSIATDRQLKLGQLPNLSL